MSALPGRRRARRRFLAATLWFLAGGLPVARGLRNSPGGLEACLQRLADQVPGSAALGRCYLQERPVEASAAWLARELFGDDLTHARDGDIHRIIGNRVGDGRASDYRNGNLVVLQGWLLTQTEARLLALLSLRTS